MATFDQAAADAAAAAAASAKTAAEAAALILSKYGDFQSSANELVSQTAQTLRGEMTTSEANLRSEFQAADSDLQESINATNTNVADNCVKWTDKATKTKAGIVMVGANLNVDATGKISVPVATNSTLGVSRPGNGMSVSNGELTYWLNGHQEDFTLKSANGKSLIVLDANYAAVSSGDQGSGSGITLNGNNAGGIIALSSPKISSGALRVVTGGAVYAP